ncbi:response regulator [Candidatus Saccharibacteria bacterium]|nr:MAG: response regulator [Candidatus Saccharibacteria bacterium]
MLTKGKTPPPFKVFIVDDNIELAEIYGAALAAEGFEVQRCKDTSTAVAEGTTIVPDLILLDIMMPGLNGFDALVAFRNTIQTSTTKIIMFSALNQSEDIEKARTLGADGYIVKSTTSVDEVVAEVKAALGVTATPPAPQTGQSTQVDASDTSSTPSV